MEYTYTVVGTIVLVVFAAIFSGLNISIMSLSLSDLKRKARLGNRDAQRVLPLRQRYHLTLASVLFANVAVVSASTLNLESAFNGLVAGVVTTILMVVFGEVLPQAIFVKSALRFCAMFAPLIRLVTLITYPLSYPLSRALDRMLGTTHTALHTRAELGMLIGEHESGNASELDQDEVEIIQSALKLSEKTVKDIMKPIDEVFWLKESAVLDAETVRRIANNGYSRIPIFSDDLTQCLGVLLMKDMVNIDFVKNPVPVMGFVLHRTRTIGSRTALDTMFHKMSSIRSHLVPVERSGKIIGIITAEDLIEEIIGHEIADETDHLFDRE